MWDTASHKTVLCFSQNTQRLSEITCSWQGRRSEGRSPPICSGYIRQDCPLSPKHVKSSNIGHTQDWTLRHGREAEADCQLRPRTGVARTLDHRLDAAVKDARDPIRLGEERRVAERQRQAEPGPRQRAGARCRLGDHHERHRVAQQHAGHQNVAQFSPGRHDDGRAVIADEDVQHKHHRHDTDDREDDRRDRPVTVDRHVVDRQRLADVPRWKRSREGAVGARPAALVVRNILMIAALNAHPTAVYALYLAHVPGRTRFTAHRHRNGLVLVFPARQRLVDVQPAHIHVRPPSTAPKTAKVKLQ